MGRLQACEARALFFTREDHAYGALLVSNRKKQLFCSLCGVYSLLNLTLKYKGGWKTREPVNNQQQTQCNHDKGLFAPSWHTTTYNIKILTVHQLIKIML